MRRRCIAAAICLNVVLAGAAAAQTGPTEPAAVLREEVRAIAKPHCGSCHQASSAAAKPGALAVFDLDAADWTRQMEAGQFEAFFGRLKGKLDDRTGPRVRAFVVAFEPVESKAVTETGTKTVKKATSTVKKSAVKKSD